MRGLKAFMSQSDQANVHHMAIPFHCSSLRGRTQSGSQVLSFTCFQELPHDLAVQVQLSHDLCFIGLLVLVLWHHNQCLQDRDN